MQPSMYTPHITTPHTMEGKGISNCDADGDGSWRGRTAEAPPPGPDNVHSAQPRQDLSQDLPAGYLLRAIDAS